MLQAISWRSPPRAFMLLYTPPNAIAFGSGYVTIGQMIKGGSAQPIALVLITATTMTLGVRGWSTWRSDPRGHPTSGDDGAAPP